MSQELSRVDYLWITKDQVRTMMQWTEQGVGPQSWFDELDRKIEFAAEASNRFADPETIGHILSEAGIIGTGNSSIALTQAAGDAGPGIAKKLVVTLTMTAVRQIAFLNTFMKVMKFALRVFARDLSARGVLINASDEELTLHTPRLVNCASPTTPLSMALPPPQKIVNPYRGQQLEECYAVQLLSLENNVKQMAVNTTYTLQRPNGKITGIGFGIPYKVTKPGKKDPPDFLDDHSIITPYRAANASQFFDDWKGGKLGAPQKQWKSEDGYSAIWRDPTRIKPLISFGIVFTGGK
jgi:hypothetical protein